VRSIADHQAVANVADHRHAANGKPQRGRALGTQTSGKVAGEERAQAHAGDHRHEEPAELLGIQAQDVEHERRGRGDVDEDRREVEAAREAEAQELAIAQDREVGGRQPGGIDRHPALPGMRFRQQHRSRQRQQHGKPCQRPEDRLPGRHRDDPATDDRRHCRSHAEHHRHQGHQTLRRRTLDAVANDGPADDLSRSCGHALQSTEG
jgi:hypothetical protein